MPNRLLGGVAALAIALGALAYPSAEPARAASAECTGWTSSIVPPTSIRVYRTAAGRTVTVPFRTYVERVMAAEWGRSAPAAALRIGAVAVKQYAWYFTMYWRGGRDAAGRCYDVVDTERDQIYDPGRQASAAQLAAVAATWHVSLRKGDRFFMTGYRPGVGSCTANLDGWRLYQRDAVDCVRKRGDTAETLARRFFSYVSWTTPGAGDFTGDVRGDLAVLTVDAATGATTAQVLTSDLEFRAATASSARAGLALDETPADQLLGRARGDVDGDGRNDLVQLVRTADGIALEVIKAGPDGLAAARTWWREAVEPPPPTDPAVPVDPAVPPADENPLLLVVTDFDGDGRADAGILREAAPGEPAPAEGDVTTPAVATLQVARSTGTSFRAAEPAWKGPADVATSVALAGDVTGDGRGDLVLLSPDEAGGTVIAVAASTPFGELADLASWGTEPLEPDAVRALLGDTTRDGRDDLLVVRRSGEDGIRLVVYRSSSTDPAFVRRYFSGTLPVSFAGSRFAAADLTGDGRADLAALVDRGTDEAGTDLGTEAWTFLSDGVSFTPRDWLTLPALDWETAYPY